VIEWSSSTTVEFSIFGQEDIDKENENGNINT
jgi:hypothetical protein